MKVEIRKCDRCDAVIERGARYASGTWATVPDKDGGHGSRNLDACEGCASSIHFAWQGFGGQASTLRGKVVSDLLAVREAARSAIDSIDSNDSEAAEENSEKVVALIGDALRTLGHEP